MVDRVGRLESTTVPIGLKNRVSVTLTMCFCCFCVHVGMFVVQFHVFDWVVCGIFSPNLFSSHADNDNVLRMIGSIHGWRSCLIKWLEFSVSIVMTFPDQWWRLLGQFAHDHQRLLVRIFAAANGDDRFGVVYVSVVSQHSRLSSI